MHAGTCVSIPAEDYLLQIVNGWRPVLSTHLSRCETRTDGAPFKMFPL